MKTTKMKSQSEAMGLALIMIIIVLGLLIYIRFSLMTSEPQPYTTQFTFKQLPVLLNDAMLQTHTLDSHCYGERIQTILMRCGEGNTFTCSNNQDACTFARNWISNHLNKTLDQWNMEYQYTVYRGDDFRNNHVFPMITNADCSQMNIDTEIFFFRMSNGQLLNMKLDLCS